METERDSALQGFVVLKIKGKDTSLIKYCKNKIVSLRFLPIDVNIILVDNKTSFQ